MENYLNHIGKKVKQRIKIYELAFFSDIQWTVKTVA